MKNYKEWLLDRITECNKHIIHLQEDRNREMSYQQNINQRANQAYKEAYESFKSQGLSDEEADEEARGSYDYIIDKYSDNRLEEIDDEIEYYQYMAETYRLAVIGLQDETI